LDLLEDAILVDPHLAGSQVLHLATFPIEHHYVQHNCIPGSWTGGGGLRSKRRILPRANRGSHRQQGRQKNGEITYRHWKVLSGPQYLL
jgi:hypothetical protein